MKLKRFITIALIAVLIMTAVFPAIMSSAAKIDADRITRLKSSLGKSYTFTFGEDGDRYDYNAIINQTDNYKGLDYYPVWTPTDTTPTPAFAYKTMYDDNGENGVDVLNISAPNGSVNAYFTPLTADGTPFEVLPGRKYKVHVKAFVENETSGATVEVSLGSSTTRTDANHHNNAYTFFGSRNGYWSENGISYNSASQVTAANRPINLNNYFSLNCGGSSYSGHYGTTTDTAFYIGHDGSTAGKGTGYLGVPSNSDNATNQNVAFYDTAKDLVTFELPLVNSGKKIWDADGDGVQDYQTNHNFLTLFFRTNSGVWDKNEQGQDQRYIHSYSIQSITITEVGTYEEPPVNEAYFAIASASSETADYPAYMLNDGLAAEDCRWEAESSDTPAWVQLDWTTNSVFDSVRLFEHKFSDGYRANGFKIEAKNSEGTYEKVYEGKIIGDSFEANLSRTVTTKSLRITFTDLLDGKTTPPSITEIEVYNNSTGAASRNYGVKATASSNSERGDYPPAKVNDGSTGNDNRYVPHDNSPMPIWIQLKWDTTIAFDTVNIYEWMDGNSKYRLGDYTLESSIDGSTWTTLTSGNGIGKKFTYSSDEFIYAKYLRLTMKGLKDGIPENYKPCIQEIEVLKNGDNANIIEVTSDSSAIFDEAKSKITVQVVPGSDKTAFDPSVVVTSGATFTPEGRQDFTNPVKYTVTSKNGKITREYKVMVADKKLLTDKDLSDKGSDEVAAYGPVPSPSQYKYQKQELAAFCHFGMKTFTNLELMTEAVDISTWTLKDKVDTDGYIRTLKDAGFDMVIYTAKHHDGLCMWDTKWTDYNITNTVYGADFLAELSASCNKYDMDMGLYLQPWDVHSEWYGYYDEDGNQTDAEHDVLDYNDFYAGQLEEILSNPIYGHNGKFREIWLDGAKVDGEPQEYDFDRYVSVMHKYEGEDVLLFGPQRYAKVRWVMNERGIANEETWATSYGIYNPTDVPNPVDGKLYCKDYGQAVSYNGTTALMGYKYGNMWMVNECDTCLTSTWFWGPKTNIPKTLQDLREIYLNSVGHNSTLLLNVPINASGTLDEAIATRVVEFGQNIKSSFEMGNFLEEDGVTVSANSVLSGDIKFKPSNVFDGNDDTYWTAEDGEKETSLHINFGKEVSFDSIVLEEAIQYGQRVESFKVTYKNPEGKWVEFTSGTTIGGKRVALGNVVTTSELFITFVGLTDPKGVTATPVISHVGVYKSTPDFEKTTGAPAGFDSFDNKDKTVFSADGWTSVEDVDCISGEYILGTEGQSVTMNFSGTKAFIIGNRKRAVYAFKVSVDGGPEQYVEYNPADSVSVLRAQRLFETDTLDDKKHTMTLTVVRGEVAIDALFAVNNGGKGYIEFEQASYITNEDMPYEIKLVRKGGTKGSISALIQDLPGSAVQMHYYTTGGVNINFADGEYEKTFTLRTMRYPQVTGTLSFALEIVNADENDEAFALGFNTPVTVSIIDAESYGSDYITSFEAVNLPTKRTYRVGDKLDLSGLKIKATYLTGDTFTLYNDQYKADVDILDRVGDITVTVTPIYDQKAITFTVKVTANGDLNGDGTIDICDLVAASKKAENSDVDLDGDTDAADLALIRRNIIAGDPLPDPVNGGAVPSAEQLALQYGDYYAVESKKKITLSENPCVTLSGNILHAEKVTEVPVTMLIDGKLTQITVKKAKTNLILIDGQSNARGVAGELNGVSPITPDKGNGFIWNGGGFSDLNSYVNDLVAANNNNASVGFYPALAAEWYDLTGEKTAVIHIGHDGAPINFWKDRGYISDAVSRIEAAIAALQSSGNFEITSAGYYWLQGESNMALAANPNWQEYEVYTTPQEYINAYLDIHNAYITALEKSGVKAFGGILTARSRDCTDGRNTTSEYAGARAAQQYLANNYSNIYMASTLTDGWNQSSTEPYSFVSATNKTVSVESVKVGLFASAPVHYAQNGYNILGLDAADNIYKALKGDNVTDFTLVGEDAVTVYKEGDVINAADNMRRVGTQNTFEANSAQLVALPSKLGASANMTVTAKTEAGAKVSDIIENNGYIPDVTKITETLNLTVTINGVSKNYKLIYSK